MKSKSYHFRILAAIMAANAFTSGCQATAQNLPADQLPALATETATHTPDMAPIENMPSATPEAVMQASSTIDPDQLAIITPENISEIAELAHISPIMPPRSVISIDGRIAALAYAENVEVYDLESGLLLADIQAELPDCQFGDLPVMVLNADGRFIALVTRSALQVWQVGGGILYESPFIREFSNDAYTCGLDMPQMAISPDGTRLAVSGMSYSRDSLNRFFRVIDIFNNEVVYEWDGNLENLHGNLIGYQGLGFSSDGSLLAVFDHQKFAAAKGQPHRAFRYWSTKDWQELTNTDARIGKTFSHGDLLFPLYYDDATEIRMRTTGMMLARLQQAPCSRSYPCAVRFSPDGSYALFLGDQSDKLPYKDSSLTFSLTVINIKDDIVYSQPEGLYRNLDGVLVGNNGELTSAVDGLSQDLTGAWWVRSELFDGLIRTPDGTLTFIPHMFYPTSKDYCPFCATCRINPVEMSVSCQPGFVSSEGAPLAVDERKDEMVFSTLDGEKKVEIGTMKLAKAEDALVRYIRFLGASIRSRAVFYCMESNQRSLGCTIHDIGTGANLAEPLNISHLRFSPDGQHAAFFDERDNELVIMNLDDGSFSRRSAYEARAYPTAAHFYKDGSSLAFIIQNIGNRSVFSLELMETESGRSSGRMSLNQADISDPAFFDAGPQQRMWIIGSRNGRVAALGYSDGELLHNWQIDNNDELVSLAFTADGRMLVTMGENGLVRLWGVMQ